MIFFSSLSFNPLYARFFNVYAQMKRRLHFFIHIIHSSLWLFSHFLKVKKHETGHNGMEGDVRSFTLKYDFHIPFIIFFLFSSLSFSVSFRYLCERSEQQHKKMMPYSNVTIIIHAAMKYCFVMHFWLVAFMLSAVVCSGWVHVFFFYLPIHVNTYFSIWSEKSSSHEGNISITSHRTHIRCFSLDHIPARAQKKHRVKSKRNEANANIFRKNLIKMRASQPGLAHLCDVCAQNVN